MLTVFLFWNWKATKRKCAPAAVWHFAQVCILNAPGTIDADCRDEVKILVVTLGDQPLRIQRGDRIGQLVVA